MNTLVTLVKRSISYLPSPLARLIFFASIRDSYTGKYIHEGWATVSSAPEVHSIVKDMHTETFQESLKLPLVQMCEQLRGHFRELGPPDRTTARFWLRTEPFRDMVPEDATVIEREFFFSQMRAALEAIVRSLDVGFDRSARSALPPRRLVQ